MSQLLIGNGKIYKLL